MKNKEMIIEKIISLKNEMEIKFNLENGELDGDFSPIINSIEYNL